MKNFLNRITEPRLAFAEVPFQVAAATAFLDGVNSGHILQGIVGVVTFVVIGVIFKELLKKCA